MGIRSSSSSPSSSSSYSRPGACMENAWTVSIAASTPGVHAKLRVSSGHPISPSRRRTFFLFKRKSSDHQSVSLPSAVSSSSSFHCDLCLRLKAQRILLRLKLAAGKFRDIKIHTLFRFRKAVVLEVKGESAGVLPFPRTSTTGKSLQPSHSSKDAVSPFDSMSKFIKRPWSINAWRRSSSAPPCLMENKTKGSAFVRSAGIGACLLFFIRHITERASHLPEFLFNTGSSLVSFLMQKSLCNRGSNSSRLWQRAASALQIFVSVVRRILAFNTLGTTVVFAVAIGFIILANRERWHQLSREREGRTFLLPRLLLKLLMVVKQLKRCMAFTPIRHAIISIVLVAVIYNRLSQLAKDFSTSHL